MGNGILDTTFAELLREFVEGFGDLGEEATYAHVARIVTDRPPGDDPPARGTISKIVRGKATKLPSLETIDLWARTAPLDDDTAFRWKLVAMLERAKPVEREVLDDLIRKAGL